jgi:hypothetical protein
MGRSEVEQVLANWIAEATTPPGSLPPGTDAAQWIAQQFLRWWQSRVSSELDDAESAVKQAWQELERLGGWSEGDLGEAMHELIHARDALSALRVMLGLPIENT